MATFNIISPTGETLNLSRSLYFDLINIENQSTVESSISSLKIAGADGDIVNNVATNPRTLTMTLVLKGNIELSKRYIMRFCKSKLSHTISWQQEKRTLVINGILESINMQRWKQSTQMILKFYCPSPYWMDKDATVSEIADGVGLHYFTTDPKNQLAFFGEGIVMGAINTIHTQTFVNDGDVSTGLTIDIYTQRGIDKPIVYADGGVFIGINRNLEEKDHLVITTGKGNKDIKLNGVSIISDIIAGSTFPQLHVGENTFRIDSNGGEIKDVYMTLSYRKAFV